jgi:hypothetical protein
MICNRYGQFTDTPVDEAWFLKFNVLWLPTDHRKILNRQPEIILCDKARIAVMLFDIGIMSN